MIVNKKLFNLIVKADTIACYIFDFLLKAGEVSVDAYIDFVSYQKNSPRQYVPREQSVYNAFSRLKKRGYLESEKRDGKVIYRLPELTRKELLFLEKIKTKHQKPLDWDMRWRLVSFDIPEIQRKHRDALRWRLKRLGLEHFQHSIWLTPYPLTDDFYEIIEGAGLGDSVLIIDTDKLPAELKWRKVFKLSNNSRALRSESR